MVLTYGKYIELLSALDEHCNGTLEKNKLQDAIFNHYMNKYGSFVAENVNGAKRLFTVKTKRKVFRNFMNEEISVKRLKRLKSCQK